MPTSCICEDGELRPALRKDLDRYVYRIQHQHGVSGSLLPLRLGLLTQGMWATTAYRLLHYVRHRRRSRPLAAILNVLHRAITVFTRIYIDPDAHVGPGLKIPHSGNIIVGPVRIGANCDIFQGVTLGASESTLSERPNQPDVPTVGDRVWIGPGAVVAGCATIADDAVVGANSLLVRDVPPRGVMIGVPARLVSTRGSFTQITYRDMESDDERKLALAELEAGHEPAP